MMVVVLSVIRKEAIVAQKAATRLPSHKLSEQFGIGSRTVRKIVKNAKDGVFNHGNNGRPSCLDVESDNKIVGWMVEFAVDLLAMSDEILLAKIKKEAYETYMRRHPTFINNDRRRKNFISYRSLKTYQKKYRILFEHICIA